MHKTFFSGSKSIVIYLSFTTLIRTAELSESLPLKKSHAEQHVFLVFFLPGAVQGKCFVSVALLIYLLVCYKHQTALGMFKTVSSGFV